MKLNTRNFSSVEELDQTYSEHLDSLLTGGFLVKDSPEHVAFIAAWNDAVESLKEELAKPRDFSQL